MRKVLAVPFFMVIWITVATSALLWGFTYNWPDFVHVDYGIPLNWATNTLSTIAGSVNLWSVNITNLLVDIMFWFIIMTIAVTIMVWKLKS